mmetsp:Transcript_105966/g.330479  ORF Transcript_105966/g.330479 Transcript_105966/m.330479 type:complete len:257 (+) Transcript_105966:39-809(+)
MCWSWQVSLVSACLEWSAALCMHRRKADGRDQRFAHFIAAIAVMESTQGLLWFFALDHASGHAWANRFLSFFIWLSAWVLIPLSIIRFADGDLEDGERQPKGLPRARRRAVSVAYFVGQALLIVALQAVGGAWETGVGPHHHQVWICTRALTRFGEHVVGDSKAYLFCVGLCFVYVTMLAFAIWPMCPRWERNAFLLIGIATFSYFYYTLAASLEACSVWCWSAGSYTLFFLARPHLALAWQQDHASYRMVVPTGP